MKLTTLLALAGLLFITACSKEKEEKSTRDLLTANRWKLTSTVMMSGTTEVPQTIDDCRKDDLWEYKSDGTFALYPGSVKCDPDDEALYGNWELLNENKSLKVTVPGGYYIDEVKSIEAGKLQLTYTAGNVYVDTYTAN